MNLLRSSIRLNKHDADNRKGLTAMKAKLLRALAAALLSVFAISTAFALTMDQTRIFPQRQLTEQAVNYYRVTINFNDQNIGSGQQFGALAANTYIYAIDAYVRVAFNAGSTNTITLGTTKANANEIVASGITAATPGVYHLTSAAGLGLAVTSGTAINLWAKYAQTGTAAGTGAVDIVIAYMPNNDM
jgi:hypothetical protein